MIETFVYDWMFLIVYFTAFMVDILKITLVFKVQVPRHKIILLCEFSFAYAFFTLKMLLKSPNIDQPYASNFKYSTKLLYSFVS